jgi:hypothetical protein
MGKFGMGMGQSHTHSVNIMMSMTTNTNINKGSKRSSRRELQRLQTEIFDKTVSRCENIVNSYNIFNVNHGSYTQADNHAKCRKIVGNLDLTCFVDNVLNKGSSEDSNKEDECLMKSIRTKINSRKKGNGYDLVTTDMVSNSIQHCVMSFDHTIYSGLNQGDKILLCLSLYNPTSDFTDILTPFYVPMLDIVEVIFFGICICCFIVLVLGNSVIKY